MKKLNFPAASFSVILIVSLIFLGSPSSQGKGVSVSPALQNKPLNNPPTQGYPNLSPEDEVNLLIRKATQEKEASYDQALQSLMHRKEDAQILIQKYSSLPSTDQMNRWLHLWILTELSVPESLKAYQAVLDEPIPALADDEIDPHSGSNPKTRELVIKTTAVEGTEILAQKGNQAALEMLYKSVSHSEFSVRRAAVLGYLAQSSDQDQARADLKKVLNTSEYYLMDITRTKTPDTTLPSYQVSEEGKKEGNAETLPPPRLMNLRK